MGADGSWVRRCSALAFAVIAAFWLPRLASAEPAPVPLSTTPLLAVHGPEAPPSEGDPDFGQTIWFERPTAGDVAVVVRLFDPDVGGAHDGTTGDDETRTRFALFDGADRLVAEATFGADGDLDGRWVDFAALAPGDGAGPFRLEARGLEGAGTNVFEVAVVADDGPDGTPLDVVMWTEDASLRIPAGGGLVEVRLDAPETVSTLRVESFDVEDASIGLEGPFRTVPLGRGDGSDWWSDDVALEEDEAGAVLAVVIRPEGETSSTMSLRVATVEGETATRLPLRLPARLVPLNGRPTAGARVRPLDCGRVEFDGAPAADPEGEALAYLWRFDDGVELEGRRVVRDFDRPGPYEVRLEVRDPVERIGRGAAAVALFDVRRPPTAAMAPLPPVIAPGEEIVLDGSASVAADGNPVLEHEWLLADGSFYRGSVVPHRFDAPGDYAVRLLVRDGSNEPCDAAAAHAVVRVNAPPSADAGPDRLVAVDERLVLDAGASVDPDGSLVAWRWTVATTAAPSEVVATFEGVEAVHVPRAAGAYRVTLAVEDDSGAGNGTARDAFLLTVNAPPVADAGPDLVVAAGDRVPFDAAASHDPDGSLVAFVWDFGDGRTGAGPYPAFAYHTPGTYVARLEVIDDSGTANDRAVDEVRVTVEPPPNAPPVAVAGGDFVVVAGERVRLDGRGSHDVDGNLIRWHWDLGDGHEVSDAVVSHVYWAPGRYRVRLEVTDDSGRPNATSSATATVTVTPRPNALPVADAGPERTVRVGEPVRFDGGGSVDPDGALVGYRWHFGDGTVARGRSPLHAFQRAGVFEVTVEVEDRRGALASDRTTVTVQPRPNVRPVAAAGGDRVVAPGEAVVFDGTGSTDADGALIGWRWDLGDGTRASGPLVTHRYGAPGRYTVRLTVEDGSGRPDSRGVDTAEVHVNAPPVADAGPDRRVATGATVAFDIGTSRDPEGGIAAVRWSADGTPVEHREGVFERTFDEPGRYTFRLEVEDDAGVANSVATDEVVVVVNAPPTADAGADRVVVREVAVVFDGSGSSDTDGNIVAWRWDFGDGREAQGPIVSYAYPSPGRYEVTLTVVDDSGLANDRATDSVEVVIEPKANQPPRADAGPDRAVEVGEHVVFDAGGSVDPDGTIVRYAWRFGDGAEALGIAPTHVYWAPGTYTVTLLLQDDTGLTDGTATDEAIVTVRSRPNLPPVADPGPDRAAVVGEQVAFDGTGSRDPDGRIIAWRWTTDEGESAFGPRATFAFTTPGERTVTLEVEDSSAAANAVARAEVTVRVRPAEDASADGDGR